MSISSLQQSFSIPLLEWFDKHGRKDLPWQKPKNAYRVWLSEIMLQQTQVKTVIPYFTRFLTSFPDVATLALAPEDQVLAHWSGLGYYSRARNLHKTAKIIHANFNDEFPCELSQLILLPGIGPSTAAAIASLAFDKPTAILDGNVKRVLSRYFLVGGELKASEIQRNLWKLAQECMPTHRCADYTQAIMDMGATCCRAKKPLCNMCPLQLTCCAKKYDEIANYPKKKQKKILPVKEQQFLLLHTQEDLIYLEKRPPTGLWGGLWCLPSIDVDNCAAKYVKKMYHLDTKNIKVVTNIKHSFSHFHLHIKALSLEADQQSNHWISECPGRWFSATQITQLGLAKPVNDILQVFFNEDRGSLSNALRLEEPQ